MKKIGVVFAAFLLLFVSMPVGSTNTTIYAPDGRSAIVSDESVETYLSLGWYHSYEDTVSTLYTADGRSATVYKADVPTYLSLGWYENYEDTVQTLYALDGRSITVYKSEVMAYLSLGWYKTYEETVERLYAPHDISILVYKAEVPLYLNLGWSRMPHTGPMVALTFDDGPHGQHTDSILDTLEKYGAKATFFLLGCQAEKYPMQVRRAHALGCDIGNHTYIHPNLSACSTDRVRTEISRTNAIIKNAVGEEAVFLRPPYGNHNKTVRSSAGMPLILWNVDPQDWNHKTANEVANHVIQYARDGSIILMHDIYGSTAEAVKIIVPALIKKGFRLVTVRELAAAKGIGLAAGSAYYGF